MANHAVHFLVGQETLETGRIAIGVRHDVWASIHPSHAFGTRENRFKKLILRTELDVDMA